MNKIAPDDPRADMPTYVAVCRRCGGWQYLADAASADTDPGMKADVKRAAAAAVGRNCNFLVVRFGDVDLTMCECLRTKRQANRQESLAI